MANPDAATTRVDKISEILEGKTPRGDIEARLFRFEEQRDAQLRLRIRGSARTKRALLRLRNVLHELRSAARDEGFPEDFRLVLNVDDVMRWLDAHADMIGREILKKPDGTVVLDGKGKMATRPLSRKRASDEKRLAAEFALQMMRDYGFAPTTTKGGQFERLAAAIYGDKRAGGFNQHCRRLLWEVSAEASAEMAQKTL